MTVGQTSRKDAASCVSERRLGVEIGVLVAENGNGPIFHTKARLF